MIGKEILSPLTATPTTYDGKLSLLTGNKASPTVPAHIDGIVSKRVIILVILPEDCASPDPELPPDPLPESLEFPPSEPDCPDDGSLGVTGTTGVAGGVIPSAPVTPPVVVPTTCPCAFTVPFLFGSISTSLLLSTVLTVTFSEVLFVTSTTLVSSKIATLLPSAPFLRTISASEADSTFNSTPDLIIVPSASSEIVILILSLEVPSIASDARSLISMSPTFPETLSLTSDVESIVIFETSPAISKTNCESTVLFTIRISVTSTSFGTTI